jgi:hypothetical protein
MRNLSLHPGSRKMEMPLTATFPRLTRASLEGKIYEPKPMMLGAAGAV